MLSKKTLERINGRRRGARPAPFVALGATVAALAAFFLSPALVLPVLIAGAAAVLFAHGKDAERRVVRLSYEPDPETAARFAGVSRACEVLASSERLWQARPRYRSPEGRRRRASGCRPPAEVGKLGTPGISANVDVWGIEAGGTRMLFFPECALVYEADRYKAITYASLDVVFSSLRVAQEGEVPADARVVGHRWCHAREDGGPDHRLGDNRLLPEVVYGLIELSSKEWPGELNLLASNEAAAAQFVLAFVGDRAAERDDHKILGLGSGASREEVTSAYRRMARVYHPDKTAEFLPEFRRLAEDHMKKINAAYERLRSRAT